MENKSKPSKNAQELANKLQQFVVARADGTVFDVNEYGFAVRWAFETRKAAERVAARTGCNVVDPKPDYERLANSKTHGETLSALQALVRIRR